MFLPTEQPERSEGYCRNCRAPLGISGICAACELNKFALDPVVKLEYRLLGQWLSHSAGYFSRCIKNARAITPAWRIVRIEDGVVLAQRDEVLP